MHSNLLNQTVQRINVAHCDDLLDNLEVWKRMGLPETLKVVKANPLIRFIRWHRWPAGYSYRATKMGFKKPLLFADYEGKRVQVVMASRLGDVGITEVLNNPEASYQKRVSLSSLSNFRNTKR